MLQICKLCNDGVWRLTEVAESEFQVYRVMRPQKWFFEVMGIRCKDESLHPIVQPFTRSIDTDLDDAMQHIPNIVNQYDEATTIVKMKRHQTLILFSTYEMFNKGRWSHGGKRFMQNICSCISLGWTLKEVCMVVFFP